MLEVCRFGSAIYLLTCGKVSVYTHMQKKELMKVDVF